MKNSTTRRSLATLLIAASMAIFGSCNSNSGNTLDSQLEIDSLRNQLKELTLGNEMISENLVKFDSLDFRVFTNQEWTRLYESDAKDIVVHMPDGQITYGIERHIEILKAMFVYAPNTNIMQHPIRFGFGNITCVTGIMAGTFSASMPIGGGKFIQPTGKSFSLPMCTVGIWKHKLMSEEYLFWDNQTYMNQIG